MKLGKGAKEGTGAFTNVILVLGILILLQYLSTRHPHEWDFTKDKKFSLSPLSTQLVSELKNTLEFWAFVQPEDRRTRDLLHEYQTASAKIKVQFVDPRSQPAKAREMGVNSPPPLIVAKVGKQEEQITQPDEEKITNAIHRLTSGESRVVYFLTGHGEPDTDSSAPNGYSRLKEELGGENFTVKSLALFKEKTIPADASALILINPKYPFLGQEEKELEAYLEKGGHLLFLCGMDASKSSVNLVKKYGIQIGENLVIDRAISVLGGGAGFLATNFFSPHPITEPFLKTKVSPPILLQMVRSAAGMVPPPSGIKISPLLTTSPLGKAFPVRIAGEKLTITSKQPSQTGIIPVASAVTLRMNKQKAGRLVVVGSNSFADNQLFSTSPSNKDFVLNAISWLSENENTISIHPKSSINPPFLLDQHAIFRLFLLSLVGLPGMGIILGVSTWLRRRHL